MNIILIEGSNELISLVLKNLSNGHITQADNITLNKIKYFRYIGMLSVRAPIWRDSLVRLELRSLVL